MRRKREDYPDNVQVVFVVLTFQHSRAKRSPFKIPVFLSIETYSEEKAAIEAARINAESVTETRSNDVIVYKGDLKESRVYVRHIRI